MANDATEKCRKQFARLLAIGVSPSLAYERSGFAPDPSHSNGSKLAKDPRIVAMVEEFRRESAAEMGLLDESAIEALADQAMQGASFDERYAVQALKDCLLAARRAKHFTSWQMAASKLVDLAAKARERAGDEYAAMGDRELEKIILRALGCDGSQAVDALIRKRVQAAFGPAGFEGAA